MRHGQTEPPLRRIVVTYAEPGDSRRPYDLLDCGHSIPRDDLAGRHKRRCHYCKSKALKGLERLARAGIET